MFEVEHPRHGFRRQRRALDLTGGLVAKYLGICQATMSNFERGRAPLSNAKQHKLAQFLACVERLRAGRGSGMRLRDVETARRVVAAMLNSAAPETLAQIVQGDQAGA